MDTILLSDILKGTPGVSPVEGSNLYENCVVALHHCCHPESVVLMLKGLQDSHYLLLWDDVFTDQLRRTYNDMQSVTERAAVCLSVMLVTKLTPYTVIERSRKGTGFDYMLGDSQDALFMPKARLEVSGIMQENSVSNTVESRFRQKAVQTDRSDDALLPAYVSVVEFSTPKAMFDIKKMKP